MDINWKYIILIIRLSILQNSFALKNVQLQGPEAVLMGNAIRLECSYDLENLPLYSVHWYLDDIEFFHYIPGENPPGVSFSGFNIDTSTSSANSVTILAPTVNHSGIYKCEVSTDAPLFHTEWHQTTVVVVSPPRQKPRIQIENNPTTTSGHYIRIGDIFKAKCLSSPSNPMVNFTWIVNGQQLPFSYSGLRDLNDTHLSAIDKIKHQQHNFPSNTGTVNSNWLWLEAWSELIFKIDNNHMSPFGPVNYFRPLQRKLSVRCVTNIYQLYRAETEIQLTILDETAQPPPLIHNKELETDDNDILGGNPDNSPYMGNGCIPTMNILMSIVYIVFLLNYIVLFSYNC